VQLTYNSTTSSITRIILFFANYRFKLNIIKETKETINNLVAIIIVKELIKLYKELK